MIRDEWRRYLPLGLIGVVVLFVLAILVAPGGGENSADKTEKVADAPAEKPATKPAATAATGGTGATANVTPQSTEKVNPHDDPVPILMYHVTKAAPAGTPYPELWVAPDDFKGQMDWLAENGYTGITMAQLFKYWDEGFKLPDKPVVISFDDGYPSHVKTARPVLAKHRWPGVLYLELRNVGNPESGLTASMVNKLIASGWELGSHTINHPDLTTLGPEELQTEVAGSREQIETKFKVSIDYFCYPAGKYNDEVVAAVERAGYTGAVTVDDGLAKPDDPFRLARVRIDGADGVDGFATKMRQVEQ